MKLTAPFGFRFAFASPSEQNVDAAIRIVAFHGAANYTLYDVLSNGSSAERGLGSENVMSAIFK